MVSNQYVAFQLGNDIYATPILNVQEIINYQKTIQLPEVPEYILGVIDFRQKVVPVIDLKKRLLVEDDNNNREMKKIMIVNVGDMFLGSVVDDIVGVIYVNEQEISKDLGALKRTLKDYIIGFIRYKEDLVKLIDLSNVLTFEEINLLMKTTPMSFQNINNENDIPQICKRYFEDEVKDKFIQKVKLEEDAGFLIGITNNIQKFIESITNGNLDDAESKLREIASYSKTVPIEEIKHISELLERSLNEFKRLANPDVKNLVITEMPEAKDSLEWVIKKTEEAVSNTIKLIEKNLNVQSDIIRRIDVLEAALKRLDNVSDEEKEAIKFLRKKMEEFNCDLMEMILIQEYQDLTGQIIKKVIDLTTTLEKELKNLIELFGKKTEKQKKEVFENQGDVDDLLKEFGL